MDFKLLCFDMDGVIFKPTNFWLELHKKLGTFQEGKELTEKYLHTDYEKLVEEVVEKLWKGRNADQYFELVHEVEYMDGVKQIFEYARKNGLITAIISTSSLDLARRVQMDYGVDHVFTNEIIIRDNKISGDFLWPIGAGTHQKAKILRDLCSDIGITTDECICIGDGASEIEVFREAGFTVAFNSDCEELKKIATIVVEGQDLKEVVKKLP